MRFRTGIGVAMLQLLIIQMSSCANFVAFLLQTRSHISPVLPIAQQLKKYNHTVTFVLSNSMEKELLNGGINILNITAESLDRSDFVDKLRLFLESKSSGVRLYAFINVLYGAFEFCHNFMSDQNLHIKLRAEKFDYAIVDYLPTLCFEGMAYKLSLPFIFIGAHVDFELNRTPVFPAFMPTFWSSFNDKMNFSERVKNLLLYLIQLAKPSMPSFENIISKYAPDKPYITNAQLRRRALLHIVDSDVLLDFPLPIPPNIILCGGLAATNAKPLPANIKMFAELADGIVVVSFGSIFKEMPTEVFDKFILSFQSVKQLNFIFRYGSSEKRIGNVLLLPWLPQNDILGYHKTRLFITHCGKSGLFEALYHGVPVIGFPLGSDQLANSAVVVDKEYGISMDLSDFSMIELVTNINRVAFSDNYRASIKLASEIFHSRPETAPERAAYWIDLVTKYGTRHFRPASMDMKWYTYYMVDVLMVLCILVLVFITILIGVCNWTFKRCRKLDKRQKRD